MGEISYGFLCGILFLRLFGDKVTHNQLTNISFFPVLFLAITMMSQVPPNLSFFKIILYLSCVGNMFGWQGGFSLIFFAICSLKVPSGLYAPSLNVIFWTYLDDIWSGYLGKPFPLGCKSHYRGSTRSTCCRCSSLSRWSQKWWFNWMCWMCGWPY